MENAKQILHKLVDEIPDNQALELIDFITFMNRKKGNDLFQDLEKASASSIDFWLNEIDDEVWNHV
jgi:hypothetical protein